MLFVRKPEPDPKLRSFRLSIDPDHSPLLLLSAVLSEPITQVLARWLDALFLSPFSEEFLEGSGLDLERCQKARHRLFQ